MDKEGIQGIRSPLKEKGVLINALDLKWNFNLIVELRVAHFLINIEIISVK